LSGCFLERFGTRLKTDGRVKIGVCGGVKYVAGMQHKCPPQTSRQNALQLPASLPLVGTPSPQRTPATSDGRAARFMPYLRLSAAQNCFQQTPGKAVRKANGFACACSRPALAVKPRQIAPADIKLNGHGNPGEQQ
jgi:hypothetical protein